ncbi:MAG: 16S rRNA (adenine(1518)-N(6)/adenine(1519)-N(6))-dimethyltransferase RsmA [Planctomycetaceae bacterium]|nr:16S rRNA (adenine(1518)-N(6)/adenine(1519)-N(6))-dimethyltransferase RsmA [Planctomycetaceae bacterium]
MSTEPLPRQTLSFLQRRFREAGVRPKTPAGQNFLIDLNLLDVLIEAADVSSDDVVLEVGTGTGSLTARLAQQAAAVVTVEIDAQMHQLASEELHRFRNVVMLRADALKSKNWINPQVLEAVNAQLTAAPGRRLKLVANLPYNIATPLMSNLLAQDNPPMTMTATIQRELAERITARPGSKDYGALSVWIQSQCRVEILRTLPPEAFWPRPKVYSAFIQITLDDALRSRIPDRKFFHDFLRSLFLHRRKFLRSQLLTAVKEKMDKAAVDGLLARLGLDATLRAERLDVDTLLRLCEAVRTADN